MPPRLLATLLGFVLGVAGAYATDMPMVMLKTTYGDITLDLEPELAPETSANFLRYVEDGFYDGSIFHRVIQGFMIQGGGLGPGMTRKATRGPIRNEADNTLANRTGTIAMARTSDPHSATAQFFINTNDNHFLDFKSETREGWGYCVFGGSPLRHRPVLHQYERQPLPRLQVGNPGRVGVLRVRPGGGRHGCRQANRGIGHRHPVGPS